MDKEDIILIISGIVCGYGLMYWITLEFNPINWTGVQRLMLLICSIIFIAIIAIFTSNNEVR